MNLTRMFRGPFAKPFATVLVFIVATGIDTSLALAAKPEANHGDAGHGFTWFGLAEKPGEPVGLAYILINFVVLLFILNRLVFRPLRRRNEERSDRIRTELEKAIAARTEAEALMNQCRARMDGLDREIAQITDEARRQAAQARDELLAAATSDAERIRQGAHDFAEREAVRIRRQVEAEVIERAVAKAEALIRANFNPGDQARLVEACVGDLKHLNLAQSERSYKQ